MCSNNFRSTCGQFLEKLQHYGNMKTLHHISKYCEHSQFAQLEASLMTYTIFEAMCQNFHNALANLERAPCTQFLDLKFGSTTVQHEFETWEHLFFVAFLAALKNTLRNSSQAGSTSQKGGPRSLETKSPDAKSRKQQLRTRPGAADASLKVLLRLSRARLRTRKATGR